MKWLFGRGIVEPTCPGCGRELVEWTDIWISNGCREERLWRGCPAYRDMKILDPERNRHYAQWGRGSRTPLRDEP